MTMKKSDINPIPPNFAKYIELVPDIALTDAFDESIHQLDAIDKDLYLRLGDKIYAPDKWTVKETLQHLADSDRIMAYQALMLARDDQTVLSGFDEKLHVKNACAENRVIDEIIGEIKNCRISTKEMFSSFDREMLLRRSSKWKYEISALAMGFTIVGHQINHLRIIEELYFPLI